MKNKIVLISTHEEFSNKCEELVKDSKFDVDIYTATLESAVNLCNKLNYRGIEIFISRGGNAEYLAQKLNCSVVKIPHDISNYIETINKIKGNVNKVGIFIYGNTINDIEKLNKLTNIELRQFSFSNRKEAKKVVKQASNEDINTAIGGILTGKIAENMGFRYYTLQNSKSSIRQALNNAENILEMKLKKEKRARKYKLQMEKYKTILNYSYDGIIGVDYKGKINVFNSNAEKILEIKRDNAIGRNANDLLSVLDLEKVYKQKNPILNKLIKYKNKLINVNIVPIIINEKLRNIVITIQDANNLQKKEYEIRRKLQNKGLLAKYNFKDIKGKSKSLNNKIKIAKNYSETDSTIFIQGESGTGKELFAQSIHNFSNRNKGPFVAINCAALPTNLLESELFGYEEGAFTGAQTGGKKGLFELAHRGTIFLDEIAEMDKRLQSRLLRVIQERQIMRLGGRKIIPIDVRIISATNRDLEKEVKNNNFRKDLYYRINVLKIKIPPLRKRKEDVVNIGRYLLKNENKRLYDKHKNLCDKILNDFKLFSWDGNVRELKNVIKRLAIIFEQNQNKVNQNNYDKLLEEILDLQEKQNYLPNKNFNNEKQIILNTLKENNWNKTATSRALNISRTTLWRKIKKFNLEETDHQ